MDVTCREAALFEQEAADYRALLDRIEAHRHGTPVAGLELTCIGNAGGASNVVQGAPCGGFLMRCGDRTLIVDPGENALKFLVGQGFDPYEITDVLASHSHNDHVGELSLAISAATNLAVGAVPDSKIVAVPSLMDYTHASATRFGFTLPQYAWRTEVVPLFWRPETATLCDGKRVTSVPETRIGRDIRVTALEARYGPVMAAGFRIETPFGVICYSGDTEYFPDLVEQYRGANLLWLNMNTLALDGAALHPHGPGHPEVPTHTHLGYVGACELIAGVRPRTAIVTHLGAQIRDRRTEIEAALRARFAGTGIGVHCPRNGDSYVFPTSLDDEPELRDFAA